MDGLGLLSPAGPFSLALVCVCWDESCDMLKSLGTATSFPTLVSIHCSGAHLALQKSCWDARQAEIFFSVLTPLPDPHVSFQRNTTVLHNVENTNSVWRNTYPPIAVFLAVILLDGEFYPGVSDQYLPGRTPRNPWLVQALLSPQ